MNKEPKFRIVERYGRVHVQQQKSFLGLRWWETIKRFYPEGTEIPIDYGTVEQAKSHIDKALLNYRLVNVPEVITYYPA